MTEQMIKMGLLRVIVIPVLDYMLGLVLHHIIRFLQMNQGVLLNLMMTMMLLTNIQVKILY